MKEPTMKDIITTIAERRRAILPIRVYEILNRLDTDRDGINQAFSWIVDLLSGKCIVFSGAIGSGKTVSAAFMACYYMWLIAKPVYDGLKDDPALLDGEEGRRFRDDDIFKAAINEGFRDNGFRWVKAEDVIQLEWSRYDSGYEYLLIIDDLGRDYFKPDSDFGPRRWDELFDARYRDFLPTIITTNLTPKEFEARYGKRNRSRLREWGIWIEIAEKDLRQ